MLPKREFSLNFHFHKNTKNHGILFLFLIKHRDFIPRFLNERIRICCRRYYRKTTESINNFGALDDSICSAIGQTTINKLIRKIDVCF